MHLNNYSFFAIFFLFSIYLVNADDLPTLLWNIKGNALQMKPSPALGGSNKVYTKTIQGHLKEKANILVYAVNKLSLEDFSASDKPTTATNSTLQSLEKFLDSRRYVFLSSVSNPLKQLHDGHCGVREIVVDHNIDENVLQSISMAFGQSCVVILHISNELLFGSRDPSSEDIDSVFLPELINPPENIVGIFTGDKTSWLGSNNDHHISRKMLQVEEEDKNFVNVSGCIFMYVEKVTVQVGKGNKTVLPLPANTAGSSCSNGTAVLQLAFKTTGDITSALIKFNFQNKMGSWVTDTTVTLTGKEVPEGELPAYSDIIEAPMKKSFNCGNLIIKTKNNTKVVVTMKGFQVQPFPTGDKFNESFDCVPFFTVPIWMGVFVSLLFIIIINVGVYALFSVHTMDRFDDPKGKTISVAAGSD